LSYHEASSTLVSVDESGLVNIWDLNTDKLRYQLDTGLKGSIEIKLHPEKSEIAILVNNPGSSSLSVWNWETGRNLFTKTLETRPVQFDYSGKGKFLFITRVGNPSIVLYDSQSGRQYSYLRRLNGFFSYAYVGSSEATIMAYSNSGYFRYYDIRTSSLKSEVETTEDLSDIRVLDTEGKRYLLATKNNTLMMIDRLTGRTRDSMSVSDMAGYSIDQQKGVISIVSQSSTGRLKVSHVSTSGAYFSPVSTSDYLTGNSAATTPETIDTGFFRISDSFRTVESVHNRVFLSDASGNIWNLDPESMTPHIYKKNELAHIQDISFDGNTLYVLTESELLTLNSSYFGASGVNSTDKLADITMNTASSPLPGNSRIEGYGEGKLLIWSSSNSTRGYVLYDPETGKSSGRNDSYKSGLRQLSIRGNQVLALESSGEATLSDLHTGIREFGFSALGMVSLNFLNDSQLIAGKSLMKTSSNPTITVETETGEITPIDDDRFFVYQIISPEAGPNIYSTGLKLKSDGTVATEVRSHRKNNPSLSSTIYSINGEFISSIFSVDTSAYTPTLYGSITGRDIIRLRGSQSRTWAYDKNIEKIFYHQSVLYIVNSDGSLTLVDPRRGSKIMDYYLMSDGNWIAIMTDGSEKPVVSDRSAADKINSFSERTGLPLRNSYLVRKPAEQE
ncbi:MAG: WD40 repeat domain-containing protein, partial [Spirochaetales bacterium]|nr:WD40 repeat domain-containing protein [Spirochaetales bacterium]